MTKAVGIADDLAEFEEFRESLLPALRQDLSKGMDAETMQKKYSSILAARGISIGLTEEDSSKALAAIRDILDRTQGKAKESKEIQHRLGKLKDDELDAFLLTQIHEMDSVEGSSDE